MCFSVGLVRISIIAVASEHPQTRAADIDPQGMKPVLRGRSILGIETDQVLGTQLTQYLGKGVVELGSKARSEDAATGARSQRGQRVLAADIAPGVVDDRNNQ